MNLLFRVLHAAHARGTHHKLAFDAVDRLGGSEAEPWKRVFLKHADQLMLGAKAPDDVFKDFTNHVLHPRDDWWGGAPVAARNWYQQLIVALKAGDWALASYRAGVLSHYLSDPLQPFHTGQSEAECSIHRAFEWSISNSYGALMGAASNEALVPLEVPNAANWLEILLAQGAGEANAHYEKLIAHFDIHRAVIDPAAGLDVVARRLIGRQLNRSAQLIATVLQRAIAEANVAAPDVALGLDTLLAIIKVPAKKWLHRLECAQERVLVERMYDELKATGTVEKHLPEDDRTVRDRFAAEVLAKRVVADPALRFPYAPDLAGAATAPAIVPPAVRAEGPAPVIDRAQRELILVEPPRPAPIAADQAAPLAPVTPRDVQQPVEASEAAVALPQVAAAAAMRLVPVPARGPAVVARGDVEPAGREQRLYLTGKQAIVDAPSIGPKMAERLEPLGLKTVDDLLAANPEHVAAALDAAGVDAVTVRDWQDQARLVCTIPGLRGTHAQLLVGAGFRDRDQIADVEADVLCARVLEFAATPSGHRVLRSGDPPDIERIKGWLECARLARAA